MGVELHITRGEFWADNEDSPITAEEWRAHVEGDEELRFWPENGPHCVRWLGRSSDDEPWLDWSDGNISTKWPDTALYLKMLAVAAALGAQVQDDNGDVYALPGDWEFEP